MNAPGNHFLPLKLLAAQSKNSRLTILLLGSSTIYTSSMTNPLANTRILHVDTGKNGILEIFIWDRLINELPCRIITLPGLAQILLDSSPTQTCIEAITTCIAPIHCICFATRLHETTLHKDEQIVIKQITTILGEQAWNYAIIVLTHSNAVKDLWKRADMMKKRSENIRAEISLYTGWDIAATITSVPITTLDDIVLDEKNWLPEFYEKLVTHSNNRELVTPARALPADENNTSSPTPHFRQDTTFANKLSQCWLMFLCWYLSSALVGAICMGFYGSHGFIIGLAANLIFWLLLTWLLNLSGILRKH